MLGNITSAAEESGDYIAEIQELSDGIIDFKLSQADCNSVQEWLDGELTAEAGQSSEWYVFALSRSGEYDFSAYNSALRGYLSENEVRSASSRLKYGLILACTGGDMGYISETLDSSIGEQGIMSIVYGLHLLNNGFESSETTAEEAVNQLLSLQKSNGGWAVMGDTGETDTTAMTVQALAPFYRENSDVKTAVDKALSLLSERQLEGGDFASYGVPNAESTAQVITMLTSLGLDPFADSRFIKNGNTLLDGLMLYRNSDGSFCHEAGKEYNESATVQAFYSLVSCERFYEEKTGLFIIESNTAETDIPEITEEPAVSEEAESISEETEPKQEKSADYKLWACLAIGAAGVIGGVILVILKKGKKQNLIALGIIAAAGILFVVFTDFSSAEDYYGKTDIKANPVGTVTLSVRCDTIIGKSDADYIPDDGLILQDNFEIETGETVFDILVQAAKKHSIQLDYSGSADSVYVEGINYIYEFDFGDLSGWLYRVNSKQPSVGCGRYTLSDGDSIEFLYTCEMGNDLN